VPLLEILDTVFDWVPYTEQTAWDTKYPAYDVDDYRYCINILIVTIVSCFSKVDLLPIQIWLLLFTLKG
jgi:hypothetical protein